MSVIDDIDEFLDSVDDDEDEEEDYDEGGDAVNDETPLSLGRWGNVLFVFLVVT